MPIVPTEIAIAHRSGSNPIVIRGEVGRLENVKEAPTVRMLSILSCNLICLLLAGSSIFDSASGAEFLPTLGFEDDVDVIVSPGRGFLVVPEESEDGAAAQITIFEINPDTGEPIAPTLVRPAIGFENAVDPFIVTELEAGIGYPVIIPMESEDGSNAGVLLLRLDEDGTLLEEAPIELGNLGFRPDVDGTWTHYLGPAIAFLPLESHDGAVRGVLAIDVDARDGDFGGCSLISTDGRAICEDFAPVPWLPPLADGVDPVAYEIGDAARLALPVMGDTGSDLLLIDFDPNDAFDDHPLFLHRYISAKEANAGGDRPLSFPGYEIDVDVALFWGECIAAPHLLVPVEGDEESDVYLLDQNGEAIWAYSIDSGSSVEILGFEKGVDLVPLCDVPVAPFQRVAIPVENADGSDADLIFADLLTGAFLGHVESLTTPKLLGYEIGIEPFPRTASDIFVCTEGNGSAEILLVHPDGSVADRMKDGSVLGFTPSVDPIAVPLPAPDNTVIIPVAKADGSDANVLAFFSAPTLVMGSLETANPGLVIEPFVNDVDLGILTVQASSGSWIYLPEEAAGGAAARLRFQPAPAPSPPIVLAIATENAAGGGVLRMVDVANGGVRATHLDVLGLETGLDMNGASGPLRKPNPPGGPVQPGFDPDTDPTLVWLTEATSDAPGLDDGAIDHVVAPWRLGHRNPFVAPGQLFLDLGQSMALSMEVIDASGRRVRSLLNGQVTRGMNTVEWDGRSDRGEAVATGVYFVRVAAMSPAGERVESVSRLVLVRD